jgi:hypothetical protein
MADHRELACLWATTMDISVAPAHRALSRAKIGARYIDQRFTERGAHGLIANERCEDITFLSKNTAGDADRFLASADVNAAGDQTAPVKTRELLFENPRLEHDAERLEIFLVRRFFQSGSATLGGLKHPTI